jgi:hypothetical protein
MVQKMGMVAPADNLARSSAVPVCARILRSGFSSGGPALTFRKRHALWSIPLLRELFPVAQLGRNQHCKIMKTRIPTCRRWLTVALFAVAMAWVESAVVFYLRTMLDRIEPYQTHPLPLIGGLGTVELIREAATLIMLLAVGILSGRTWRSRLGYAAVAFGIWDIFYYLFLKVMCGWPNSVWDWDILFLLPLPWWGPVLAPVSIALLMILWGTLVNVWRSPSVGDSTEWKSWLLNFVGVSLALYLFMADSLRVAGRGTEALRDVLPVSFNWPLFCIALLLMAAPAIQAVQRLSRRPKVAGETTTRAEHGMILS